MSTSMGRVCFLTLVASCVGACYLHHRPPGEEDARDGFGDNGDAPFEGDVDLHPALPEPESFFETPCREPRREPRPVPLDVLFMVDNSGSMREEQESLSRELPNMINMLTAATIGGQRVIEDLHLGVVSSDLGLVGIEGIPGCQRLGDDGVMNNVPSPEVAGCLPTYPRFLSYAPGSDPDEAARDFTCIAMLGTEGCGFEQQLESALKALWPAVDVELPNGRVIDGDAVSFLGDVNGFGRQGHGSAENAGFLRHGRLSVIAIVMLTDEDDCSSRDTRHFTPDVYLPPDDPLVGQDLNLRCFFNQDNLYTVERYLAAFAALRPGRPRHVFFSAIAGVPPDLVDAAALADLDPLDPESSANFYDRILADPRMQERPDPTRTPEQGDNLTPSCETESGLAYPPRRIVDLARRFGPNGVVQSICQGDFGAAIEAISGRLLEAAAEAACSE